VSEAYTLLAPALYERAGALVEQLFEAPTDPQCWQRMLTGLSREISPDSVALVIGPTTPDGRTFVLGHGLGTTPLSSDDLLPWCDHRSLREARAGSVFSVARACPVFAATALYQNLLGPAGLAPGPGFCVVLGRDADKLIGFVLVLSRNPNWVPRTEDHALLELLAPYLIRAVVVGLHLHERRSGIEALLSIFDALVMGVVLLDARGEVSFCNRSAAELLGTSAGAPRAGSSGAAERKRRTAALKALTRREFGSSDAALSYPHPVDGRPLHIVSTPLRCTAAGDLQDPRFASALFFGDPGIAAADSEHGLADLYHLTPAQERLALRLAAGETLAVAAEKLGIRLSTARWVLRSVFEKTDTRRQAELVRLVLTVVGRVRLDAPRG
jgi:DNA-binding CsgD family transcriptional regulator